LVDLSRVIVGFIVINQFVVWFLRVDYLNFVLAGKTYLDNQQLGLGISILKPFLRENQGNYESYKLLALLYLKQGDFGRSHIQR
jgi:predicted Zn-dependent protease